MREGHFRRVTAILSGCAVTLAALVSAGGAVAAPGGLQDGGKFLAGSPAQTLSYGGAEKYWTPERIANATPLELATGGSTNLGSAQPELFSTTAVPFNSTAIKHPARYPNRVHGKLLGTFAGLGNYSCSATVVSSGSASLLTTAGHCAFDVASRTVASNLAFIPGFSVRRGAVGVPDGIWPVTNLILNKQWVKRGKLDFDFAMMRTGVSPFGALQSIVGSRGIGFNQPRKLRLEAYGYPAKGRKSYNGTRLVRCKSRQFRDPFKQGGPRGRGMKCDQQQGSSGGGFVAQHSFVISNVSHGYPQRSKNEFFGPYYGALAKSMYKANTAGWPSIGPVKCGGKVATIIGSNGKDRIRGTGHKDIIATRRGKDKIAGRGGRDVICAGGGNDKINGGGGRDKINGGGGRDRCGKKKGGNKLRACEGRKKKGGKKK